MKHSETAPSPPNLPQALGGCLMSPPATAAAHKELEVFDNLSSLVCWLSDSCSLKKIDFNQLAENLIELVQKRTRLHSLFPDGLQCMRLSSVTPLFVVYMRTLSQSSHTDFTPECSAPFPLRVLSLPHRPALLPPLGSFLYSLSMQECSFSSRKQTGDKRRKLEWGMECQHEGRKWIVICRLAAERAAASLSSIESHSFAPAGTHGR